MRTVIIYDDAMNIERIHEPPGENIVRLPIPKLMSGAEANATNDALKIARRMRAEKIIIYRELED